MKANLRITFDHYGKCITGHIEDTQMYDDVKNGKRKWESYQYSKMTHIRIPKEVFERLLELEDIKELYDQKSREVDIVKSLITKKEDEAYNKGYEDAKSEVLKEFIEKLHRELRMYGQKDKFNKGEFLTIAENIAKDTSTK